MNIVQYADMPLNHHAGGGATYIFSISAEFKRQGHNSIIIDGTNKPRLFSNRYVLPLQKNAHIHLFNEPSTAYPLSLIKSTSKLNRVITFHAPVAGRYLPYLYSPIIKYFYRKANLVLCTTKRNARLLSSYGVTSTVIPLWADSFFSPSKTPILKKPYVLTVCVLDQYHTYKNFGMLARIGYLLKKRFNIPLIHIGPRAFDLPNVLHLGILSKNELREYYRNAMLLVLPSIGQYEGFGLVAAEALACSTPVLVSDCCGISDFLSTDFVSSLVNFECNLVNMVTKVLKDPDKLIHEATLESSKFSYHNCRKTVDLIIKSAYDFSR